MDNYNASWKDLENKISEIIEEKYELIEHGLKVCVFLLGSH